MNENIDLTKILKDCPKGTKFYSLAHGEVEFQQVEFGFTYPIVIKTKNNVIESFTTDGKMNMEYEGECTLFPSKDKRDWSKFTAPWYKKEKFDPNTLQPFDKVLVRIGGGDAYYWFADFVSMPCEDSIPCTMSDRDVSMIIPYNDDTKHLVGTTEEAPEYYRYWED